MAGVFDPAVFQGGGLFQVEIPQPIVGGLAFVGDAFSYDEWRKIRRRPAEQAAKAEIARIEAAAREAAFKARFLDQIIGERRQAELKARVEEQGRNARVRKVAQSMLPKPPVIQDDDEEEEAIAILMMMADEE